MKPTSAILLACLLAATVPALAAEPMASEAAIVQLLDVTNARRLVDGAIGQMESAVKQSLQQGTAGHPLNDEQRRIVADMQERILALVRQQLSWDSVQPAVVESYRKVFTADEIAGMIAFYRSPSGQAVIEKMPQVMQESSRLMNQRLDELTPQLQNIQRDAMQKLQAAQTPEADVKPAAGAQ